MKTDSLQYLIHDFYTFLDNKILVTTNTQTITVINYHILVSNHDVNRLPFPFFSATIN